MRFHTMVELGGKTATGIHVPDEVVGALGVGKRPPVRVTIGSHTYRTTVASMGGRFMIPLSSENRTLAGVQAGDEVEVQVELDQEPREVSVPEDFAAALAATPPADAFFVTLPYSHRRRHVMAIEEAKTAETRARRIGKAVEMLRDGKR